MSKQHVGAESGVTYTIPDLDDEADIEVAFIDFADTLPAAPQTMVQSTITASATAKPRDFLISEATGPITVTLPGTGVEGDRVQVYQLGNGVITVVAGSPAGYRGPNVTTGNYTAITAIFHDGEWVGSPFSFSGNRPTASTGGEITDLNGYRYHIFRNAGGFVFMSHKDLTIAVKVVAAGGGGAPAVYSGASPSGGQGGEVVEATGIDVPALSFIPVVIPPVAAGGAAGGTASLGPRSAQGGVAGVTGVATPPRNAVALTGDWAAVIGKAAVSGNGADAVGPVAADSFGRGGSGGFSLLASRSQGCYTNSWTTPGGWVDTSYGARREDYQCGSNQVRGDNQPVFCPSGWRVSLVTDGGVQCQGISNPANVAWNGWFGGCPGGWYGCGMGCCTDVAVWCTRWHCDSGGSLNGTTCQRGYNAPDVGHSERVCPACPAGLVSSSETCVDPRTTAAGVSGGGLVAIRYPIA